MIRRSGRPVGGVVIVSVISLLVWLVPEIVAWRVSTIISASIFLVVVWPAVVALVVTKFVRVVRRPFGRVCVGRGGLRVWC